MYKDSALLSISPITGEVLGEVPVHDPASLDHVIRSCRKAQFGWVSMPKRARVALLQGLMENMALRAEELSALVAKETGKTLTEAMNTDVTASLAAVEYCIGWLKRHPGEMEIDLSGFHTMMRYMGRRSYVRYRPLGVIGVIAPFNFPLAIPFSQTVMAVASGNAVVLKPSSKTPLSGHAIEDLFKDAGFPSGLVRAVSGRGIGKAITNSTVDRIVFTGSTDGGRRVMESASQRLTPVTLELGGKDPMVILEDADVERAASAALWGSFVNAGQVCVAIKRIIVHKDIYSHFLDLFSHKTEGLRIGNGLDDAEIDMGSMIDEAAVEEMERQVSRAKEQGGKVLTGGSRPRGLKGSFFSPTIVTGLSTDSDLWREETFGPIVLVTACESDVEAVRLANDSPFALSGSVWTKDLDRGRKVAAAMRSGTVIVNNAIYTYGLPSTPWGGNGESGFGRTHGQWGMMEMMEPHHVHVDSGKFPRDIWWTPYDQDSLGRNRDLINAMFRSKGITKMMELLRLRKGLK